ncbi:(Fe-S)-binding protein [Chloroflexota bacterium]
MFDINREIQDTKARLCLDCGKCTSICPVASYQPDFNPRLIVQRRLGYKGSDQQDDTIWSCISCYMCVERCNYSVGFPEFINALRYEACSDGYQVQCSHGGALQSLTHMMTGEDMHQNRLGWLPRDISVSNESDTLFFVGCAPYFDVIFTDLGVNTLEGIKGSLRLLNHAEVPFKLLDNERCCGHDLLMQGDREGFLALARANIKEFSCHGIKRIITSCPEGHHMFKIEYPKILGETGIEVLHLTEVIAPLVQSGELKLGKLKKRVTYHDPCRLGRYARIFEQPRIALQAVADLEFVEMEQNRERSLCCGASPWAHCGPVNRQIQEQRLAQAEATEADILVTACPKCQIHLKCAQKHGGSDISQINILDLAALLSLSLDKEVK